MISRLFNLPRRMGLSTLQCSYFSDGLIFNFYCSSAAIYFQMGYIWKNSRGIRSSELELHTCSRAYQLLLKETVCQGGDPMEENL
ncbi:hypothetical protein F0562_022046 [Nyssa sinensis]|uniref:Uncharacterized protein n=1 Tax=Nyssa sinensis TaxID=561372 RepID=A0A5J5BPP9_9ASTE|nr:hypothetical protein F0562_022046 [Nyssa sinensis]